MRFAPWYQRWLAWVTPRFLARPLYRWVAKNRYHWFGKVDCADGACQIPKRQP
jgi:predicted DCC family thiol-disulfide oxidoreductase YuxK